MKVMGEMKNETESQQDIVERTAEESLFTAANLSASCGNKMGIFFAIANTFKYIYALYAFVFSGKKYSEVLVFADDIQAKALVFSYSLIFKMYKEPHYRSSDFRQDMIDNLANVAVPGTGVPLSIFSRSYYVTLFYVMFIVPFVCFCGAVNQVLVQKQYTLSTFTTLVTDTYIEFLFHPDDW